MTTTPHASIIRTERGLAIAGTRITLYDIMDYCDRYPPEFIQTLFNLTEPQIAAALSYIATHHAEVEAEYQTVLQESEALQHYYEARHCDLMARLAEKPPKPELADAWQKLQDQKAHHQASHSNRV